MLVDHDHRGWNSCVEENECVAGRDVVIERLPRGIHIIPLVNTAPIQCNATALDEQP
jgi:hypothetical protein